MIVYVIDAPQSEQYTLISALFDFSFQIPLEKQPFEDAVCSAIHSLIIAIMLSSCLRLDLVVHNFRRDVFPYVGRWHAKFRRSCLMVADAVQVVKFGV